MYKVGYLGSWKRIPEAAAAVYDNDIAKLESLIANGLDINEPVPLDDRTQTSLLEIAVFQNNIIMIRFLLDHGAEIENTENRPLICSAARFCSPEAVSIIAKLTKHLKKDKKKYIYECVYWHNNIDCIPALEQAGFTAAELGGNAFRQAVFDDHVDFARLMLEKGVDINFHEPDMVFPYASTAVIVAARYNKDSIVHWLVEQGADINISDKYGDRPYTCALKNKNQELADYLKALEPEDWHNEQEKVRQLKPYKLPKEMVEYLKTGPYRIEFPEQEYTKWVELLPYLDLQEVSLKRKKMLSIMSDMDNYCDYMLLWNPKDKKIWYQDVEHEELNPLADWKDFIADPGRYLNGMIDGEFNG